MTTVKEIVSAGYKHIEDANLTNLANTIGCSMENASSEIQRQMALGLVTKPNVLIARQQTILYLRSKIPELQNKWNAHFKRLSELESDISSFFKKGSSGKDMLEDDAISQISFNHTLLKPLNQVPWMILCITLFKIWMVPLMSFVTPILIWILPYILLKFVYLLPISQEQYTTIIKRVFFGVSPLDSDEEAASKPITLQAIGQYCIFGFSLVQSMVQPIQNAIHLYKTDSVCYSIGSKIIELRSIVRELRDELGNFNGPHTKLSHGLESLPENDIRRTFIFVHEYPHALHVVLSDITRLECMWRIACFSQLNPVEFKRDIFQITDGIDLSLGKVEPVASTIKLSLHDRPHTVLTGPNGGGKSSFLRSILQTVLLSHSYGMAPAKEIFIPRFLWVASGIQLRDTPGKLSMFETEVKFAADCIQTAKRDGPGLVLFDELFHSTNPPDGIRTANIFLKNLWNQSDLFSIVSTHVFPLIKEAPKNVMPICCPATQMESGDITYSFGVQPGICEVSSVHKVWERFGLSALNETPAKSTQEKE